MEQLPREYLESNMEPDEKNPEIEFGSFPDPIKEPFFDDPYEFTGLSTKKFPNGEIFCSYKKIPENLFPMKGKELKKQSDPAIRYMNYEPQQFRELENLNLLSLNHKLELTKILPEGWKIYFSTDPHPPIEKGVCLENTRTIIINQAIQTPKSLLSLLHEIGHAILGETMTGDYKKLYENALHNFKRSGRRIGDKYESTGRHKVSEEELAVILELERKAWSFALSKIKPFLSMLGINRKDLEVYIHKFALASYSKEMRAKMQKGFTYDSLL